MNEDYTIHDQENHIKSDSGAEWSASHKKLFVFTRRRVARVVAIWLQTAVLLFLSRKECETTEIIIIQASSFIGSCCCCSFHLLPSSSMPRKAH